MDAQEYYKEYLRRSAKRSIYISEFFNEHLDGKPETEEEVKEMNDKAQQIVDELFSEYEDEIEILIN
ncbi:hypothetical protein [Tenuibacillus multivorans]|uniref:hypothetical protein n=1 Tax=Tenuibacillus multivorans TaxID=237069 RepID=UPI000B813F7F|nr:hypothetical protein [Tenuibacillus multivorans]GEL77418.1 hypothetical protein TMU01_16530 [Tenuibacillus multivorans]